MTSAMDKTDTQDDGVRRIPPRQAGVLGAVQGFLESSRFQRAITVLIVINAITLGIETSRGAMEAYGSILSVIDRSIVAVFVA